MFNSKRFFEDVQSFCKKINIQTKSIRASCSNANYDTGFNFAIIKKVIVFVCTQGLSV